MAEPSPPDATPDPTPAVALSPREKALRAHDVLCAEYGCPIGYFHDLDPLSELVSSLLSHRTRNRDSGRAFKALRAAFPSWTAVRDAPVHDVEAAIAGVTWPEQKAPRIQQILRLVGERVGHLDAHALDFLGALPPDEARAWLEALPGVGPKTSAAVLSFSRLRGVALPVDSHHHRVAVRLGLIPPTVAVGPSHALLAALVPAEWDAQAVYDHHEVLMLHGQRVCFWREPACDRCAVLALCPTGHVRLGRALPPGVDAPRDPFDPAATPPAANRAVSRAGSRVATAPRRAAARGVPPGSLPSRASRGAAPRRAPQEQLEMADQSHDQSHDDRGRHADPQQGIERMNEESRAQVAQSASPKPSGDVNDREHYRDGLAERAHGTHGKGFMDETRRDDEQAVDTGDDPQLRTAGGGGDQAPDPQKFRENSPGRMGGPGWGNESAGGSSVDRRPRDGSA